VRSALTQDGIDHGHEAHVLLVLQAHHVGRGLPGGQGIDPGGSRRSGCSFSQPRLTTITSPPKFGLRLMLRTVRMGIGASGASMATPQP
jgi:hypothetical protein